MSAVKLLIADVDGTLLTPSKVLSAQARSAVERLEKAGIAFAIASGRPPRGLAALVQTLALSRPVAAFNGGMLLQPDLTTVIKQRTLPEAVAGEVVARMLGQGLEVWVYRGTEWFVTRTDTRRVSSERATVQFEPTVLPSLRAVLDGAVKIVGVSDDLALLAQCEGELRQSVAERASVARSQPYYLDVTHPDANKGMVARDVSSLLDIPLSQVAVIGDMPTDVLMFGLAGMSIAMGNASTEVQRCARYVTTANDREGFANAVERFILAGSHLGLPSRTRACLFDLDGVLTQTSSLHAAAWKQAFDEELRSRAGGASFVPFDEVHDYARYVDGRPRSEGVRAFFAARQMPLTNEVADRVGARKNDLLQQAIRRAPVATYRGSERYLRAVRDAGLKTAVVSSSRHCQEVLASAGIAELFDARIDGVVAEREHLGGKPAPDTYLAAARALDVTPAEAAVFEDALAGVEAGRAGHFGCVVGVDRIGQAEPLRQAGADLVVSDLATLMDAP